MFDILILAFQTDSTRVATLLLAHDGSNRSFDQIGIPEGHHDLRIISERQNRSKRSPRLISGTSHSSPSSCKSSSDQGRGRQFPAAQFHDCLWQRQRRRQPPHPRQPAARAGRRGGGTLKTGRYVKHGWTPLSNLFLSMADRMGLRDVVADRRF